jgi:phosphomannomutase/phosphoglucomutase
MKVNPHIFRAYDIRGIAQATEKFPNIDLNEETAKLIGKGTGTYLQKTIRPNAHIVVGRDNRLHSPKLQEAFIEGLLETGCNVTNIGVSPSPMVYYAVCKYKYDGGVNITASHNPKKYNGIKIVSQNAHSVCGDELQKILEIIENEDFTDPDNTDNPDIKNKSEYKERDIFEDYKSDIASLVNLQRPLKVVVDAGNGTAGKFAPDLLRELGCEVVELYCELDGNFPNHEANPEEYENMKDLIEKVKETDSDLGLGFDGDGDRVGVVDKKGHHYSADYLLMLLARDLLKRQPGAKIVFDVKVSQSLIDDIKKHGGEPVMSKTGHSFIESKMKKIGAPLAGEVSGHLFFAENYYGFDDAFLGAAKLLEILANQNKDFSELFDDVPKTYTTPEFKAHTPDDKKFKIVEELKDFFTEHYDCITIDGVRVNFTDKAWGAVRCSNTSPNLTLRFEADSEEKLNEIQKKMVDQLRKHPEVSLDWYELTGYPEVPSTSKYPVPRSTEYPTKQ